MMNQAQPDTTGPVSAWLLATRPKTLPAAVAPGRKKIRDLRLYGIWKTGQLKNEKKRRVNRVELFRGKSLSKSSKTKTIQSRHLQAKFDRLNSLFQLLTDVFSFFFHHDKGGLDHMADADQFKGKIGIFSLRPHETDSKLISAVIALMPVDNPAHDIH
jgi:hypothetical protein